MDFTSHQGDFTRIRSILGVPAGDKGFKRGFRPRSDRPLPGEAGDIHRGRGWHQRPLLSATQLWHSAVLRQSPSTSALSLSHGQWLLQGEAECCPDGLSGWSLSTGTCGRQQSPSARGEQHLVLSIPVPRGTEPERGASDPGRAQPLSQALGQRAFSRHGRHRAPRPAGSREGLSLCSGAS